MNPDDFLRTKKVAAILGSSVRHVQRELEAGRLRGVRHGHGWRVTRLEVWRYQGIADAMLTLWLEQAARNQHRHESLQEMRSDYGNDP